ncbi:MAG: DUF4038 domain-containing protein [Saprospiraceae bacterium]|nr:DUF4038 domain-containing protein [Saprospiraceae bacterium]
MKLKGIIHLLLLLSFLSANTQTEIWHTFELNLTSGQVYTNPLYEIKSFYADFSSPTGQTHRINGFWDGDQEFKIRFAPDEIGEWSFVTYCSNQEDKGLHAVQGKFQCKLNTSELAIYQKGSLQRSRGNYHIEHADGTPFFYTACTAWNGALKSTPEEWDKYLKQRAENDYNVIQFVTTQWRGCERDSKGEVAFIGSGRIEINPAFFQRLDKKVEEINAHGLIAAPVLLWALPFADGRELSPGYYLPQEEAILLAKYLVARYGGHQVIWILGGDGKYTGDLEQRWKTIGRGVFGAPHPGLVAQHPHGSSWIGELYKEEHWLDIVGYQSSHNNTAGIVDWINKGPMAKNWDRLPARPIMNLEPNYEEIRFKITAEDVRNASYWSLMATPISGITYGANGIWPWIQEEGELIENHGNPGGRGPSTWEKSIDFPGSLQIGYLSSFFQQFNWWELRPAQELLLDQPGQEVFNHFIGIVANASRSTILAYTPKQQALKIRNRLDQQYEARWFDPIQNRYEAANLRYEQGYVAATPPREHDFVLILQTK